MQGLLDFRRQKAEGKQTAAAAAAAGGGGGAQDALALVHEMSVDLRYTGTQFTCFTRTKVQR